MGNVVIRVEGLGKMYRIGAAQNSNRNLRETLTDAFSAPFRRAWSLMRGQAYGAAQLDETIWALKDVSFEVQHGEVVGIIGRNGAGKSTLLKVLSRITEPTEGYVDVYGRVGSLLEVGTGFHNELTGRENIYLNGAILGMSRQEIDRKFDEIVDFAGVERFIDTPVKHYSSGMRLRLGFSVAAHLEPEILVVDEVLAVGDAEFQKKCLGKMSDVASEGRTVLFVSHNMGAVQSLCTRGMVFVDGQIRYDLEVERAIQKYLAMFDRNTTDPFSDNPQRKGDGQVLLTSAHILNQNGEVASSLVSGTPVRIEFEYENPHGISEATIACTIYNHLDTPVTHMNLANSGKKSEQLGEKGVFQCEIPKLPLPIGDYRVAVILKTEKGIADWLPNAVHFSVEGSVFFQTGRIPTVESSTCLVEHNWNHVASPEGDQTA